MKDGMGGACGMHVIEEHFMNEFRTKTWKKNHLDGVGLYGRIILKWFLIK
jgi:hypothetical protein